MARDLSKPAVEAVESCFGGGWAFPITEAGKCILAEFFDEPPAPIAPHGGRLGYIVEPWQTSDLAAALDEAGETWRVEK